MKRMQQIHRYVTPVVTLVLATATGCVAGDLDTEDAFDDVVGEDVSVAQDKLVVPGVTLYEDVLGGGASLSLTDDVPDLTTVGWNDVASSLVLNDGTVITAYEHTGFGGRCETFTSTDWDLRDNVIGNDTISSIRFGNFCRVTLYEHINGGGASVSLTGDMPDLGSIGWNDVASSLVLDSGVVITAYEHGGFLGRCETFTSTDWDLRDNFVGNDTLSSIRFGDFGDSCTYHATISNQAALVTRFRHYTASQDYGWNQLLAGQSGSFDFTAVPTHEVSVEFWDFGWHPAPCAQLLPNHDVNVTVYGTVFGVWCDVN